jgi:hypothetical protein
MLSFIVLEPRICSPEDPGAIWNLACKLLWSSAGTTMLVLQMTGKISLSMDSGEFRMAKRTLQTIVTQA